MPGELPEEDEISIDEKDIDSEEDLEAGILSDERADSKNETGSLELSDLTLDASDDLTLDEVGGSDTGEIPALESSTADEDDSLDLGELVFDEDDESLDLGNLTLEEPEDSGGEDSMASETMKMGAVTDEDDNLDLGDLAFDEDPDEESFDLSDIAFDDASLEDSLGIDHKETGELQISDLEESKPDKSASKSEGLDDDISIDLENLDLDLDLDDTEDK